MPTPGGLRGGPGRSRRRLGDRCSGAARRVRLAPLGDRREGIGSLALQAAGVAGRESGAAAGPASALPREIGGARPQAGHDRVDLPARRLDLSRHAALHLLAQLGLPLVHLAPGGGEARVLRGEPLALGRHLGARGLELAPGPLRLGQVLGELGFACAAASAGILDHRCRQTQPVGDLEGEAPPRHPVVEAVGGGVRLGVEAEAGAGDALRGRRVRLQQVVVRRRRHERAATTEALYDGRAERAALRGIGPRADFVQQDERRQRESLVHLDDVRDVAREGGQAVGDGLVVADVREHRPEDAHSRAPGGRHVQAGLGHQDQQPGRLQGDGLAAGVRPRHDEGAGRRSDGDVDGHRARGLRLARGGVAPVRGPRPHRRDEQGMARRRQLDARVGRERRLHAVDESREPGAGLDDVELGGGRDGAAQVQPAAPQPVRQGQQDAPDLVGLVLLEGDDVVVDLDRAQRLEEQAGPASRAAVHDAGDRASMLRAHEEHEAPVAFGDDLFLQVLRRVAAAQERGERVPEALPLLPQPFADGAQLRRRAVDHFPLLVDGRLDLGDLALERAAALHEGPQARERIGAGLPNGGAGGVDRGQKGGETAQLARFEQAPLDGEGPEGLVEVLRPPQGEVVLLEEPHPLGGGRERRPDGAGVRLRSEIAQGRRPERRQRQTADRLDDEVELQRPQRAVVHPYILAKRPWPASRRGCLGVRPDTVVRGSRSDPYSRWLMLLARAAAPKPLSMLTTATPEAQLLSMARSAASPPKAAP